MLVDDLRAFARDPKGYPDSAAGHLCNDAADQIEKLRAENLELAKHIDGCVRVAADALKRAEVAEAVCRITSRVGHVQVSGGDNG